MYTHVYECVHLCMCIVVPEVDIKVSFSITAHLFLILDTGPPAEPGAFHLARLAG